MQDESPRPELSGFTRFSGFSPEHATCLLVFGLLLGSLGMLAWEWTAQHLLHVATVPGSKQQRLLITMQMALWAASCASAMALLFVGDRYVSSTLRLPERFRMYVGPATWWSGATALFSLAIGRNVLGPAVVGTLLFVGYRACSALLSRSLRSGTLPAFGAVLWASTLYARRASEVPSVGQWSGVSCVTGLAIAAFIAKRRWPSSAIAGILAALTLVAVAVLELPRMVEYPYLLLGIVAYAAAVSIGTAPAGGSQAGRCWGAAIVAAGLLPLCEQPHDVSYLASSLVAGSVLAMLLHATFPRLISGTIGRASDGGVGLGVLGLVVAGAALILPYASTLVLGAGLGLWGRLFVGPAPEPAAPDERRRMRDARLVGSLVVLAVVARLIFWFATDRVWEDALITIRHAENAVAGRGLTHHPAHGLVHGFTSPLSVLVPLVGELIRPGGALATLRIASILAGAATVWFAGKIAGHPEINLSTPAKLFWLSYLAFDHSQIAFGMAGMETQIWTCVLMGGLAALIYGRPFWLALALACAALSRPEGVVWIGIALFGWLVQQGWRRSLAPAALVVAGVLPWVAFATWYYGSPVPNTIRAKSGYLHNAKILPPYPNFPCYAADEAESGLGRAVGLVAPHFQGHGLGPVATTLAPGVVAAVLLGLGAMGAVALIRPRTWIIPVFFAGIVAYFLLVVQIVFCWYPPPILGVGALLVASGIDAAGRTFSRGRGRATAWALGVGLAVLFVAPLPLTFSSEKLVQKMIDDDVRRRVGLWLGAHSRPDDYVTAECLGYLGYYSNLPFHDYPGLCSPRAVAALKAANGRDRFLLPIVEALQPTWLVLRERELPFAPNNYEVVHAISMSGDEKKALTRYLPLETIDHEFFILRNKARPREAAR